METAGQDVPWLLFFTQSFYHVTILPMLATTVGLAYAARPSTTDEMPSGFRVFQAKFLTVWGLCVAADWLQGPYVYALYAAYGYSGQEIAELFVAGFGSSLIFGCVVGTVTDKFGRKRCCVMYCVLYIVSCLTKHFKVYPILMVGRLTGGIATSMLFSCFECWMVSEHLQRYNFSGALLGYLFGMMFTVMYIVAILSGLVGQFVADSFTMMPAFGDSGVFFVGGYVCPFDVAIVVLLIGMFLITLQWEENYGTSDEGQPASPGLLANLQEAWGLMVKDRRTMLLGVVVSAFEGSMFAFVFNWTPALDSTRIPPPHGVIFALFMMCCMCGASASTLLGSSTKPMVRLIGAFALGFICFAVCSHAISAGAEDNLRLSFFAFLAFEFCVGIYFPSIGVLKSEIVPEHVRGTVYNMYRVPLNAIVVGLLLSSIDMATCFRMNAVLLLASLVSIVVIAQAPPNPPLRASHSERIEMKSIEEAASLVDEEPTLVGRRRPVCNDNV